MSGTRWQSRAFPMVIAVAVALGPALAGPTLSRAEPVAGSGCSASDRIQDAMHAWVCSQDFAGDWTDANGVTYTETIHFDRNGTVRVSVVRKDNQRAVGGVTYRYATSDYMIPRMDAGAGSICLLLLATVDTPQRDGSPRAVETTRGFHLEANWSGLETAYTDADDFLNFAFVVEEQGNLAPLPLDIVGGRLCGKVAASSAMKASLDSLLAARDQCFLEQVTASEEFGRFCTGRYADVKQPMLGITTDVLLTLDDHGAAQLDVAGSGRELPGLHFEGRLSGVRRFAGYGSSRPPENAYMLLDARAGDRFFQASRTLLLDFVDASREHWLQVACHYDEKANVRFARYVMNHVEEGKWVSDRFWWQDRVDCTGLVEAR